MSSVQGKAAGLRWSQLWNVGSFAWLPPELVTQAAKLEEWRKAIESRRGECEDDAAKLRDADPVALGDVMQRATEARGRLFDLLRDEAAYRAELDKFYSAVQAAFVQCNQQTIEDAKAARAEAENALRQTPFAGIAEAAKKDTTGRTEIAMATVLAFHPKLIEASRRIDEIRPTRSSITERSSNNRAELVKVQGTMRVLVQQAAGILAIPSTEQDLLDAKAELEALRID